jgi:YggT family protein
VTRELIANVINTVAQILYVLILARIVVSWIGLNPWNPIVRWLRIIVDPILRPFRRVLPTFGGIDFSPLLAILVIFFIARSMTNLLVAPFAGIGRRGQMHSMYTHQRVIDVPALLALGLYVVLYFVVLNIFNRLVLPAVL